MRRARLLVLVTALLACLAWVAPTSAATNERCFPETGFCISGTIRQFWEHNGGLPVFGYPLSSVLRTDDGQDFQVFERHIIEPHPENRAPYDVELSLIGQYVYLDRQGATDGVAGPGTLAAGCRWFAETQHNLCAPFAAVWQHYGLNLDKSARISEAESLALFGLPITEPYTETGRDGVAQTVQYFQRARFELHPEIGPNVVLFGLLGREFWESIPDANTVAPAQPAQAAPAPTVAPPPAAPPAATPAPARRRVGAICRDGTRSSATGSGACSHHGGVREWIYE